MSTSARIVPAGPRRRSQSPCRRLARARQFRARTGSTPAAPSGLHHRGPLL